MISSIINSKILMSVCALALGALGLALTFAPAELLRYLAGQCNAVLLAGAQLCGALYLGFAFMNWMARESTIGGIYNRPLAIGNFTHFTVGGLALLKSAHWIAAAVYLLFAIGFGVLVFTRR